MITIPTLCALALQLWTADAAIWYAPRLPSMLTTCEDVATEASRRGHDPALLISVAWEESRMTWATSPAGAVGPLQALPSLWCPQGTTAGCDLIAAGVDAWEAWADRYPVERDTLCHYNGGNRCGPQSLAYAERVITRWQELAAFAYGVPDGC